MTDRPAVSAAHHGTVAVPRQRGGHRGAGATGRREAAVAARRTELRARRRLLAAGVRADVAGVLAGARLACAEQLTADLDRLRVTAVARIGRARPRELDDLRRTLSDELAAVGERTDRTYADRTGPELRRLAARLCPGAPLLPVDGPGRAVADVLRSVAARSGPVPSRRSLPADPRLLGVLAGLPVLAAHGIGLPAATVTAGLVLLAGCVARVRSVDGVRARMLDGVSRTLAAAAVAGDRELARRVTGTEAAVVAALERAVVQRQERVAVELAALDTAGAAG